MPRHTPPARLRIATLALLTGLLALPGALRADEFTDQCTALRLAIEDLRETFPDRYPKAGTYLRELAEIEARGASDAQAPEALSVLRRRALLDNPLLEFATLLAVRRPADSRKLGLPQNWQGNCALRRNGYDDALIAVDLTDLDRKPKVVYAPGKKFLGDVDLHFDANRLLYSSTGTHNRWHVFELPVDPATAEAGEPRQLTPADLTDVDHYDAAYLPDGGIAFCSTACFQGVPCVGGRNQVANLYRCDADGNNIRRLGFDQDHNWCPTVLNDGRLMYLRWEYSDTPHYFTRILFQMNPDGTGQMAYFHSNSYWPNSLFYARPVPGSSTQVAGIVTGHHGLPRMGELVLFDRARGQHEDRPALQRIASRGEDVEPIIADRLVRSSWPRFLHPWPLSEKHLLVSAQPTKQHRWGLYLVDVFDNMVLLREEKDFALLEPVPLTRRSTPPVIPSRVDTSRDDAVVYLTDVYAGPGLDGVPRGTVKDLRLLSFHYGYQRVGGHCDVALDGPWDVHRILGTVPVEPDGSAAFRVPANTPIAVQPLDAEGKALQVMRSWFTAMPGERLSCVGCHEKQHHAPPGKPTVAMRKAIRDIEPFYGPARGFSFAREVQPVLDAHCVGCHNGRKAPQGRSMPDFSVERDAKGNVKVVAAFRKHRFTPSYLALHRYVRRPTPESDYHLSEPLEFHADTSRLVQLLRKGHKGVRLDAEGWDRLITWIDLNVPDHGTWREVGGVRDSQIKRRNELNARYAGLTSDPEAVPETPTYKPTLGLPRAQAGLPRRDLSVRGWPMDAETARQRQAALGETTMRIDLGLDAEGKPITLTMVRVPAGRFVMGDAKGPRDEWPRVATVDEPFWIGRMEVTNAQFARFDPDHDSRYFNRGGKDQSDRGIPLNQRAQPVVRVSWEQAKAFGSWLSARTGKRFDLPSETQWEYAARAGSDSDAFYGSFQDDFSRFANLADRRMANHSGKHGPKWRLADDRFDDRALVTEGPGNRPANAFGLVHAIGNAAEWTRTLDERAFEGGLDETGARRRVVKGGSFYDRPFYARSASRRSYREYQKVFDVGFRVVCTDGEIARKSPEGS